MFSPLLLPYPSISLPLIAIALVSLILYTIYILIIRPYLSPLRVLPGPPRASLLFGNLARVFESEPGAAHLAWAREYGPAVKYGGFLGQTRVFFTDPAALNHILLSHSYAYPKPNEVRGNLSRILGRGLLFAEGDDHRRQKRIMNPAFSPSALRDLTPTFFEMAYKLRDKWSSLLSTSAVDPTAWKNAAAQQAYEASIGAGGEGEDEREIVLEVGKWLSRLTLDIIGVAGFGYEFNALDNKDNKLGAAFAGMLSVDAAKPTAFKLFMGSILRAIVNAAPFMLKLVPNARIQAVRTCFEVMESESRKIVDQKKREVAEIGLDGAGGKDLITLLLKANLTDAKNQMSDAELQGQMTTFILAGHETTATALQWTLYTLSGRPAMQDKLRKEIRAARQQARAEGREELGSDELNALEYLDAVCREVFRVESPVSVTLRMSAKDDLIPLSAPILSPTTGNTISHVPVKAGQDIVISVSAANMSTAVFGPDADDFRPERWMDGSVGEKTMGVGVYSQMLTFLAGPRACIGYKFAILELKAILVVLLDEFTFTERDPGLKIERRSALVTRPLIIGEEELGHRMPLRIRKAARDTV